MGYWNSDENGNSFSDSLDGTERVWGDGPADFIGDALYEVVRDFEVTFERTPTMSEVLGGIMFSLPGMADADHGGKTVTDDGYMALIVKKDAVQALREVWCKGGDDKAIVAAVRDLLMGQDGDLVNLTRNRFLYEQG